MRVISHDGFARQSLVRHQIKSTQACLWCGGKNASDELYAYSIVPDDSNKQRKIDGYFCSVVCMRAYHA